MARATKTKDGFTVTTIEQAGAYEGQALSTGQKMSRNLLYDIKRSEQMASL